MITSVDTIGCFGLLRVASLPVRYWLSGANPELFANMQRLVRYETERTAVAARLAEQIGLHLVPNPRLTRPDRALLLHIRRQLHRGGPLDLGVRERLAGIAAALNADDRVLRELLAFLDGDVELDTLARGIERELMAEHDRLLSLPTRIYHESRVAKAILAPRRDERADSDLPTSRNRRRHRFEHDWSIITRAATGTTPRDWLSHLALLPFGPYAGQSTLAISEQFTTQWTANVRMTPRAFQDLATDWPWPESRLACNPLHWEAAGKMVSVVQDQFDTWTHVSVQRTWLLDRIYRELLHTVLTFSELVEVLDCAREDARLTLHGFIRHLVELGILHSHQPPAISRQRAANPVLTPSQPMGESRHGGWVDVYRHVETGVPRPLVWDVQAGVTLVIRLLNLTVTRRRQASHANARIDETPWTMGAILQAELNAQNVQPANRGEPDDPDRASSAVMSTPGLETLVQALAERDDGSETLVIDAQLLSACGAAAGTIDWPVDCLVRIPAPNAGFAACLDELWPPGMLDARFVDALTDMHGALPQTVAYRDFLSHLEQLTGVVFIELLIPPLTDVAANAVRRPIYTTAWTGDPDPAAYLRAGTRPARFIPMHAIQIRRLRNGSLRAELDGRIVWPMHHATRTFSPPWDRLARILLAAAPQVQPLGYGDMVTALAQMATRSSLSRVPRISVGQGIVISPAQWCIPTDQLWDAAAPLARKVRALIQMRRQYSLPRWVYLPAAHGPGVACDLESIPALRLIERTAKDRTHLTMKEMLPAPDQAVVRDGAHLESDHLSAQLQLRFPCDESAAAMAARIAPNLVAALNAAGSTPPVPREPLTCRGPPAPGPRNVIMIGR